MGAGAADTIVQGGGNSARPKVGAAIVFKTSVEAWGEPRRLNMGSPSTMAGEERTPLSASNGNMSARPKGGVAAGSGTYATRLHEVRRAPIAPVRCVTMPERLGAASTAGPPR
jgi:hypothetical protein